MSNKTLKAVLVVVAIIAISGSYMFPKVQVNERYLQDLVQSASQKLGSVVGPDLFSPYFAVNGVKNEYRRNPLLQQATTTPCAFKSPSATSTLTYADLQITTASSTATTWTLANATTPYATTTALQSAFSVSSGAQAALVSTTTYATIAPNTYVVWGLAGVASVGNGLQGSCQAVFQVL